jgi:hypothetical protein
MWIVTTAVTGGLDAMFKRRFVRLETQRPSIDELSLWLAGRCGEFGIEVDYPLTIERLAERSNGVPGGALQVLARAAIKRPRRLTRQLVEDHIFEL